MLFILKSVILECKRLQELKLKSCCNNNNYRQMEANSSLSQENPGFSPDSSATAPPTRLLPKSTYSLLECPVCLELAWPPKRIYQVVIFCHNNIKSNKSNKFSIVLPLPLKKIWKHHHQTKSFFKNYLLSQFLIKTGKFDLYKTYTNFFFKCYLIFG